MYNQITHQVTVTLIVQSMLGCSPLLLQPNNWSKDALTKCFGRRDEGVEGGEGDMMLSTTINELARYVHLLMLGWEPCCE